MTDNLRDTKFAGFAELLFRDLSRLGLVALVDVRNFPDNLDRAMELQDEMNQLTKQLIARRAYDLVYFLFDKARYHSGSFDVGYGTPEEIQETIARLADLKQWPDLPDSE